MLAAGRSGQEKNMRALPGLVGGMIWIYGEFDKQFLPPPFPETKKDTANFSGVLLSYLSTAFGHRGVQCLLYGK